MPKQPPSSRDFGLVPDDLQPPAETIRCFFPTRRVVLLYVCAGYLSAAILFLTVYFVLTLPLPVSLLGAAAWPMLLGVWLYTGAAQELSLGGVERQRPSREASLLRAHASTLRQ